MSNRDLILLSPYRLPTQNALYLSDDDVAAFLNGASALWHPAALLGSTAPPRIASTYDHDQPSAGHLYAVPSQPTPMLPDDWKARVKDAGAIAFESTPNRDETLANLREALRQQPDAAAEQQALLDVDAAAAAPFFGIGFGHWHIGALCEAMSHENLLATADFCKDVQDAVQALVKADADAVHRGLQAAAERLLAAREVLYPVTIFLVDLCLVDDSQLSLPWPAGLSKAQPCNVLACAALVERLAREQPDKFAQLRERVAAGHAEVVGGPYLEREDALLPLEAQLANLLKGQGVYQELLGQEIRVFGRKRFGFHPQLPQLLNNIGINRVLLLVFDDSVVPDYRATVVNWPSADGKQVEAFPRPPQPADTPQTFFHFAHHLHRTIMQDQAATLTLLHKGQAVPWYDDLLELSRFAPVLGRWTTLSNYFNAVVAGDYASAASADDFRSNYLEERVPSAGKPAAPVQQEPISGLARQLRLRRGVDTAWTLCALHRALAGKDPSGTRPEMEKVLADLEERCEFTGTVTPDEVTAAVNRAAVQLTQRLLARAQNNDAGYMVLNPCSFRRRLALELPDIPAPLPLQPPLIACQSDGKIGRVVVEVPAFGFAWFPKRGPATAPVTGGRMRLADSRCVRNESLEAEVDPVTGGLKAIRDHRGRVNRLGQMLVYNPGSTMQLNKIETTSTGPALGEIVSEGVLLDVQREVIAHWRQRFRAWLGRPVLDLRVEIHPVAPPQGYPWHAYYGARFAWREERSVLLRGANGTAQPTTHPRPESPDFLELRGAQQNTLILPGGLPFHQRQGTRMLDVLLICEGETARAFDLAIGLDRDYPMQTALGITTPNVVVGTSKGPPHIGASGWLFHLDAPNLLVTSLYPGADGTDAVTARLLECAGHDGPAEWRCVRDPRRAMLLDGRGNSLLEASTNGDAVSLNVSRNDLLQLRVEFS